MPVVNLRLLLRRLAWCSAPATSLPVAQPTLTGRSKRPGALPPVASKPVSPGRNPATMTKIAMSSAQAGEPSLGSTKEL
jgi:hypothetical protein